MLGDSDCIPKHDGSVNRLGNSYSPHFPVSTHVKVTGKQCYACALAHITTSITNQCTVF